MDARVGRSRFTNGVALSDTVGFPLLPVGFSDVWTRLHLVHSIFTGCACQHEELNAQRHPIENRSHRFGYAETVRLKVEAWRGR